jgi:hypothetical protein
MQPYSLITVGRQLEGREENSVRQTEIDLEVRWFKENGIICYGNWISRDSDF